MVFLSIFGSEIDSSNKNVKRKNFPYSMLDTIHEYFGNWFWPLAIISLLVLTHAGRKIYIMSIGGYYLAFSKDKSFKLPNYDPGTFENQNGIKIVKKHTKTLILLRHGESTWNEVFNRGIDWKLPFRIIYALARETILFVTSDSVLYDAPLGTIGITQSKNIHSFIKTGYLNNNDNLNSNLSNINNNSNLLEKRPLIKRTQSSEERLKNYIDILRGTNKQGTIIISSPLRRCIETVAIGCFERLNNDPKERIHLVTSLQEMTRNIDGVSLSGLNEIPPLSWSMRGLENEFELDFEEWFDKKIEVKNKGSFKCEYTRGDERMKQFINFLFQSTLTSTNDTIIISGHSLWFRFFFRAYFPRKQDCDGKIQKICNGGIVACEFSKYELSNGTTRYRIEPQSVQQILLGFEQKKKKH